MMSGYEMVTEPGDVRFRVASTASVDMHEVGHQRELPAAGGDEDWRG